MEDPRPALQWLIAYRALAIDDDRPRRRAGHWRTAPDIDFADACVHWFAVAWPFRTRMPASTRPERRPPRGRGS